MKLELSKERTLELADGLMEFIKTGTPIPVDENDAIEVAAMGALQEATRTLLANFIGHVYLQTIEYAMTEMMEEKLRNIFKH